MSFSLLLSFQSVHLFIWAAIFSGVHLSSLYPPTLFSGCFCFTSIGPWREGSVKPVHSLLIKSSFVSSLPRTVFLPIRKKSLWWTESRSVQEAPPLCLSSNQTSPVLMLSAFLSLCFFFFFFSFCNFLLRSCSHQLSPVYVSHVPPPWRFEVRISPIQQRTTRVFRGVGRSVGVKWPKQTLAGDQSHPTRRQSCFEWRELGSDCSCL